MNKAQLKKQKKPIRTYTLEEVTDKYIGKKGTPKRNKFELELKLEILGDLIKKTRQERQLTQEELGKLIGVQKAQISKLEKNATNVTLGTILRIFKALETKVKVRIEMEGSDDLIMV